MLTGGRTAVLYLGPPPFKRARENALYESLIKQTGDQEIGVPVSSTLSTARLFVPRNGAPSNPYYHPNPFKQGGHGFSDYLFHGRRLRKGPKGNPIHDPTTGVRSSLPYSPGELSHRIFRSDQHLVDFRGDHCPNSDRRPSISVTRTLLIWVPAEALVTHLITQFQHHGQLLEMKPDLAGTRCDLEAYKKALSIAERDKRDLEERFKQEKQVLNDEIRQLRERVMQDREELFEREKRALNDGILRFKVRLILSISSAKFLGVSGFIGHGDADSRSFHFPIRQS